MKKLLTIICILLFTSACINLDSTEETIPENVTEEIVPEPINEIVEIVEEPVEIIQEPEPASEPEITKEDCDDCQYFEDGECKFYECCSDMQCGPGFECRYHNCTEIECGPCEHVKGYRCYKNDCCDDGDCEKEGYIGTCENQGTKYAVCEYSQIKSEDINKSV